MIELMLWAIMGYKSKSVTENRHLQFQFTKLSAGVGRISVVQGAHVII